MNLNISIQVNNRDCSIPSGQCVAVSADATEAALPTKAAAFRWSFPLRMRDHKLGCEPRKDLASLAPVLCSACRAVSTQDNLDEMPKNGWGHLGRAWQWRLLDASLSDPSEAPDSRVLRFHTAAAVAVEAGRIVPCMIGHACYEWGAVKYPSGKAANEQC